MVPTSTDLNPVSPEPEIGIHRLVLNLEATKVVTGALVHVTVVVTVVDLRAMVDQQVVTEVV